MSDGVFAYVDGINLKNYNFNEFDITNYNQFIINKSFSFHADTILLVNEINRLSSLTNKQHYDFLYHLIPKRKRFGWVKNEKIEELEIIMEYYNVNIKVAKEYLKNLTPDILEEIKKALSKGGKIND